MKNSNIHINNRSRKTNLKKVRKNKISTQVKVENNVNTIFNSIKKYLISFINLFRRIPKCVYGMFLSILSLIWSNKRLTASLLGLISAPLLSWYLKFNPLSLIPDVKPSTTHTQTTNGKPKSIIVTNVVTVTNFVVKDVNNLPTTNVIIYVYQESNSTLSNNFKNRSRGYYVDEERVGNNNPFIDNLKFLPK